MIVVRLHAERTRHPAVVRWVVHDPSVAAAGDGERDPAPSSAVGALMVEGVIASVSVHHGDVLVRVAEPARWTATAPSVHAAIAADLGDRAAWLVDRAPVAVPVAVRCSVPSSRRRPG